MEIFGFRVRVASPCKLLTIDCVCQPFIPARFVGLGSRRFNRLKKHGQNGFPSPPVDLRYLKRPNAAVIKQSRASVVSFLTEIYHSLAETLPDVRDETWDIETSLVLGMEPPDPYEDQLTLESVKETPVLGEVHKRKRKMQKSVKVNPHRQPNSGGMFEEKWLPPGQMKDLWSQYKKRVGAADKVASFPTFWRAPQLWKGLFC